MLDMSLYPNLSAFPPEVTEALSSHEAAVELEDYLDKLLSHYRLIVRTDASFSLVPDIAKHLENAVFLKVIPFEKAVGYFRLFVSTTSYAEFIFKDWSTNNATDEDKKDLNGIRAALEQEWPDKFLPNQPGLSEIIGLAEELKLAEPQALERLRKITLYDYDKVRVLNIA